MQGYSDDRTGEPLFKRIVDFPLVAMLLATATVFLTFGVAASIADDLLPAIAGFDEHMRFDAVCCVLLIILYKLVIRHLGEPRRDDLRTAGALRLLSIGLAVGVALFSFTVGVAAALGIYAITGPGDAGDLLPQLIVGAIFPAVFEEILFRGILFRWIEEFGGSWAALVLTSALFGAIHLSNPHASAVAAVGIAFEAGIMLGAAYMITRSLWLPMGLHAGWNFMQGEVFDIPVSGTPVHGLVTASLSGPPLLTGNGFGLEASLIDIVSATLFGLWLLRVAIRRGEIVPPCWVRRRDAISTSTS
jgi:membrane protease YdiL (CAAX protease family)